MTAPVSRPPTKSPYSYTPPDGDGQKYVRAARIGITLLLIPVSLSAFGSEYGQVPLLSGINVAVHEFGHYLFLPFGEMMNILGGSLFQVIFPLVFLWYFLYGKEQHRDKHAAMVCLWWCSINILSVAIYAADARAGQLMLLSGATGEDDPEGHDWRNLFSMWGVLNRDTVYAGRMRGVAALMCLGSIVACFWLAWNSGQRNSSSPRPATSPDR